MSVNELSRVRRHLRVHAAAGRAHLAMVAVGLVAWVAVTVPLGSASASIRVPVWLLGLLSVGVLGAGVLFLVGRRAEGVPPSWWPPSWWPPSRWSAPWWARLYLDMLSGAAIGILLGAWADSWAIGLSTACLWGSTTFTLRSRADRAFLAAIRVLALDAARAHDDADGEASTPGRQEEEKG